MLKIDIALLFMTKGLFCWIRIIKRVTSTMGSRCNKSIFFSLYVRALKIENILLHCP